MAALFGITTIRPATHTMGRMEGTPHSAGSGKAAAPTLIAPASGWHRKQKRALEPALTVPLGVLTLLLVGAAGGNLVVFVDAHATPAGAFFAWALFIGTIAMLGLCLLVAWRIRERLLLPLMLLRDWAMRVRSGNLAARLPLPSSGEFRALSLDINALTADLERLSRTLHQEVARQTRQIAQKNRSLQILYEVAAAINRPEDLDRLLERFLDVVGRHVDAHAATARLLTDDGGMRLVASYGLDPEVVRRESRLVPRDCACGEALQRARIHCEDGLERCREAVGVTPLPAELAGCTELIAVPLQYQDRTVGVFSLFRQQRSDVPEEDLQRLLPSIGRHLGAAVEKARLAEKARRLSVAAERHRLGHELHDLLAQTLVSLGLQLQVLEETAADSGETIAADLRECRDIVTRAHRELRELIAHFRMPEACENLATLIEQAADRFRCSDGPALHLAVEPALGLPPDHVLEVRRIVQEALSNAWRHSAARNVRVRARREQDSGAILLLVEDDGIGMDTNQRKKSGHYGLRIMAERAARIGAEFAMESEPGDGTRIHLRIGRTEASERITRCSLEESRHHARPAH